MVIATVGAIIFWTGWAAWSGARMTLHSPTNKGRYGGAVLMLGGIAGLLFGIRLLVVTYLL